MTGRRVRLGPGAEFDLIRGFFADEGDLGPEILVGPGDDAAVLEGGWVVTTDLAVEDVHFRRDWITDAEIGYRAGAAAISDLAAMAATPVAVLVSVACPRARGVDLAAVHAGLRRIAATVGADVIGGDTSRSPGPLFIDVTALGRAQRPIRRDGAEPGDEVWVTGTLGASAAAVRTWLAGGSPPGALRSAYATPIPRVDEALCLVAREVVEAMIDLSDGLAGDLGHVAAASGVRIVIETGRVPLAPAAEEAFGHEAALELALGGGEDYELAFVSDPGVVDPEYFDRRHGIRLTRVGRVEEGEGVWLEAGDGATRPAGGGFDHWREGAD
jgi:thiamine-monophosphate kinase